MTDVEVAPVAAAAQLRASDGDPKADAVSRVAFRRYTWAIVAAAVACAAIVGVTTPFVLSKSALVAAIVLAVAFGVAELCAINIDVRSGVTWGISFTEIPLVIALLVTDFSAGLVAVVAGSLTVMALRGYGTKLPYHVAVRVIEVSAAFAVCEFVTALSGIGHTPWFAAFAGGLTTPLVGIGIATGRMWAQGNRMRLRTGARFMARILIVRFVNAAAGVSAFLVATAVVHGWMLVFVVAVGFAGMFSAYSSILRDQRDLEALSAVSQVVARSASGQEVVIDDQLGDVADEWTDLVEQITEQLAARRVVLRYRADGVGNMRTVVAGEPLPPGFEFPAGDPLLLNAFQARPYRVAETSDEVRTALRARGAEEVLIAPLRNANQLLGVLEAHDRKSRWRGFGRTDVQLISTMGAHMATALDNTRLLATLRHDAYHDPLTGLLNRPGISHAARMPTEPDDAKLAVIRIDLDAFAQVCDALGYTWADRMVVIAGRRLREVVGPDVAAARLEGASFAVLVSDTDQAGVHEMAEQIRQELSEPYPVDRLTVEANAIIGYACSGVEEPGGPMDLDGLMQCADVAVRAVTQPDEIRGYVPSMGQIFLRRFQLVSQFRQAIDEGQVSVHYQPKVSLTDKKVLGVEALVRWTHPEFGKLHPDEFVPVIEAAGLIDVLTTFVLDKSLERARKWADAGLRISVAVNLSMRSLADADFPAKVAEAVDRHGVSTDQVTFELTESGVMQDPQRALPILRELHALGVSLAVDDFGTGYSSLAYLRQLPVDEVKIDKSFVFGMGTDLGDLAVVRAIVELGHSLGLTVVAEGVEDDLARDQLEAMGCDIAQGYLISRPLSEQRLDAWLQARTARESRRDVSYLTLLT